MGDPKKQKKKYSTPSHPWQKERIDAEKVLLREYGLKNKKEIWKVRSELKGFAQQAKQLIAANGRQAEKEKRQLLSKVCKLGLVDENADLNAVLGLDIKNILDRRLQTIVYKKDLAKSMKQARQFITHRHISVAGKKITQPAYLVSREEEAEVIFSSSAALANPEHLERVKEEK
jgi:small subunit ribosomal protein S4